MLGKIKENASDIYHGGAYALIFSIFYILIVITACPKITTSFATISGISSLFLLMLGYGINCYLWKKEEPLKGFLIFFIAVVTVASGLGYLWYLSPWAVCVR